MQHPGQCGSVLVREPPATGLARPEPPDRIVRITTPAIAALGTSAPFVLTWQQSGTLEMMRGGALGTAFEIGLNQIGVRVQMGPQQEELITDGEVGVFSPFGGLHGVNEGMYIRRQIQVHEIWTITFFNFDLLLALRAYVAFGFRKTLPVTP